MEKILENRNLLLDSNIYAVIITEKIEGENIYSKVISMYSKNVNNQCNSISIPYIEGMKMKYLINIFRLFSNKEINMFNAQKIIDYSPLETENVNSTYFKISYLIKDIVKKLAIDYYKFHETILTSNIEINSLLPINYEKDFF